MGLKKGCRDAKFKIRHRLKLSILQKGVLNLFDSPRVIFKREFDE